MLVTEPGAGPVQKGGATLGAFVRQDLGVDDAAVVIDRDVDEVPAQTATSDLLGTVVCPPAAAGRDLAELLDIDVQQ